jgi:hypothetical protein
MSKNRKRSNSTNQAKTFSESTISDTIPKPVSNDTVPQTLLYELSSLSILKYKINLKSKLFSLNLPVGFFENIFDKDSNSMNDFDSQSNKYSIDYITLICKINNVKLPLVPAIRIYVPYDYPNMNAFVECVQLDEYDEDMLPEYSKLLFF